MKVIQAIKPLLPLLRPYPWVIPSIVGLGILSSLFEGVGISLFIPLLQSLNQGRAAGSGDLGIGWLDRLFDQFSADRQFSQIALFIFGCILLKACLSYSNALLFAWFNSRVSHRLRSGIFRQFLTVSYSFLEQNESGKLMNTLATETWQTSRALSVFVNLIIDTCTVLVFTALLMLLSWRLTIVVTAVMLLISLVIKLITRQTKSFGFDAVQANKAFATQMWDAFSGMKVVRAFGREVYEQEQFDRASMRVRNSFLKLDMLSGIVSPVSEVLSAALLLGILIIALQHNQAALPTLLTFLFILLRLQPKVKQIDGAQVGLVSLASSVEDVMALLNTSDKPYIRSGTVPFRGLQSTITFNAVTFQYNPQAQPALQAITLTIPWGKTTALVGPSGAGKSTLIGLLCRFQEPTAGAITVDGCPLPDLDLADWRSRIAIVSQDIYMFTTTIRDNIAYGRLDATDAEIVAAAKLANAHEFIRQLPYGYDTKVGDRGVLLSGGQRQRIALARAIVRDPEILILDEATNALDSIAENLIQEALDTLSQDRTVIVIAHRLSTIATADQILVLDAGRIVERGNQPQLLALNGLYARLYHLQNRPIQV